MFEKYPELSLCQSTVFWGHWTWSSIYSGKTVKFSYILVNLFCFQRLFVCTLKIYEDIGFNLLETLELCCNLFHCQIIFVPGRSVPNFLCGECWILNSSAIQTPFRWVGACWDGFLFSNASDLHTWSHLWECAECILSQPHVFLLKIHESTKSAPTWSQEVFKVAAHVRSNFRFLWRRNGKICPNLCMLCEPICISCTGDGYCPYMSISFAW